MASDSSSDTPERIARAIAGRLFLPVEADYTRVFGAPLRLMVLVLLGSLVLLAAPPIVECLAPSSMEPFISIREDPRGWGEWLAFATVLLEVGLAIAIGGSVFGEWAAVQSRSAIDRLQESIERSATDIVSKTEDQLVSEVRAYRKLLDGISWLGLPARIGQLYKQSNQILDHVTKNAPRANARFLAAKIAVAFPGGYFGLIAFTLYCLTILTKVLTIYTSTAGAG